MTRRTLLSAAGSLPALASTKPIRAAVYGTGHAHAMGKIAALRALPQYELVGVCEPDTTQPRTHKALDGVRWLSQKEMLEDASIELIAVESRVQENLLYAREAVDAGKFVHLDKAPGNNMTAFRALLAEAGRRKRTVQMGYMWRYHPAMQAALEAARKGWLGDVYSFRARIDKPIPPADRRLLGAFRGGMMFELGCHLIDRATDLLGKPRKVTGHLWHHSREQDALVDNTLAILEYDRAVAEISVAAMHPHGNSYRLVEITGTNGSVKVQPFSPLRLVSHLRNAAGPYPAGLKQTDFPPGHLPAYSPDFLEMARIIREKAAPSCSSGHDLMTQEVLLKACHEIA